MINVFKKLGIVCTIIITGCAGSQAHLRMLESGGALRIEKNQFDGNLYIVRISNVIDFGYDPDVLQTRNETALRVLSAQCPKGKIIGEDVIEKGSYGLGRAAKDYLIKVNCN